VNVHGWPFEAFTKLKPLQKFHDDGEGVPLPIVGVL